MDIKKTIFLCLAAFLLKVFLYQSILNNNVDKLKIESFVQNPEEAQPTIMVSGLQEVAEAGQTKPFAEKEEEKEKPVFKEPEPAETYDDYDEDDDEDDINKLGVFLKIFFTVLISF